MESPAPISICEILDNKNTACSEGMIFSGLKDLLSSYGVDVTVYDTGKNGVSDKVINQNLKGAKQCFFAIDNPSSMDFLLRKNSPRILKSFTHFFCPHPLFI